MHHLTELYSAYTYQKGHISSYPWVMRDEKDLKKVHIIGLGDVGLNAALGLRIAGAGRVSQIGIYDIDRKLCDRLEIEINQILSPLGRTPYPDVVILDEENLFDCDIFLFCATKNVPPLGAEAHADVRIAQFEENRKIIAGYAKQAADAGYKGLFGVVSDPLDLLCGVVLDYLHPDQIQGFGLGVMFARAAYYAKKLAPAGPSDNASGSDCTVSQACRNVYPSGFPFDSFTEHGRVYGPHGKGLVAVNSILPEEYDDDATAQLTDLTTNANIRVRQIGYKPYIAPGVSSVALTIPEVIAGNWNDSARYLNGVFFGARNRLTQAGCEWEAPLLPDELYGRLQRSYLDLDRRTHEMASL